MKTESPSITMSATELSALVAAAVTAAIAEKKPQFDQTTDLIADRRRMIVEAPRVWQGIYRDCVHGESGTTFDAHVQPNAQFPAGRIVVNDNLRLDPARERAIFELAMGGESDTFKKLALYRRFGPTPGMSDAEHERLARESQTNDYRIAGVMAAAANQIRQQTLVDLIQPIRKLVGLSVPEAKRFASFGKLEITDEGLRSPFPIPEAP